MKHQAEKTKLPSMRIPNYPWLVQRVRSLRGSKNPFGGASAGKLLDDLFDWDYMGSAEFEFGSLSKARVILTNDLKAAGWPAPVQIKSGKHEGWFVGAKKHRDLAVSFFTEELASEYTGMKERSELKTSYEAPGPRSPIGWWCIDDVIVGNGVVFAMFKFEADAQKFIAGLK